MNRTSRRRPGCRFRPAVTKSVPSRGAGRRSREPGRPRHDQGCGPTVGGARCGVQDSSCWASAERLRQPVRPLMDRDPRVAQGYGRSPGTIKPPFSVALSSASLRLHVSRCPGRSLAAPRRFADHATEPGLDDAWPAELRRETSQSAFRLGWEIQRPDGGRSSTGQ